MPIPAAIPLIMAAMPMLSKLFGGAAKNQQANKEKQDSLAALLERTRLDRDKFALDAPGTRVNQSMKSSLMNSYTPTKVDWGEGGFKPGMGLAGVTPKFTGGFNGGMANLDPRTKSLNDQVMQDTLASQKSGGFTGGGDQRMAQLQGGQGGKSSILDKILGGGSLVTSLLAGLKGFGGKEAGQYDGMGEA